MNESFLDYLKDQFSVLGPVSIRKMFGGAGVYFQGSMFALIDDDTVYLKIDASNKDDFIQEGMPPFTYMGKGKPISLSYYQLPEGVIDDPEALLPWAEKAVAVATKK